MQIPQDILEIFDLFKAHNKSLYIVGGSVRDHLLGISKPEDFDMATEALPEDIILILGGKYQMDFTGKSFGVIRVYTENVPKGYEIATFRKDITVGRNPKVKVGVTLQEDAFRRDLTINAIFYDIENQKVIDPTNGLNDIAYKVIRTPGEARDRFNEDKLRILRSIRFASRLDFELTSEINSAILADNLLAGPDETGQIVPISQERISEEFEKAISQCTPDQADRYLSLLEKYNLFPQIFPGMSICYRPRTEMTTFKTKSEIFMAWLMEIAEIPGKNLVDKLVDCKFSARTAEGVSMLIALKDLSFDNAYQRKRQMVKNNMTSADILIYAGRSATAFPNYKIITAFCKYEIKTTGESLKAEGMTEGEELGRELVRRESEVFKNLIAI